MARYGRTQPPKPHLGNYYYFTPIPPLSAKVEAWAAGGSGAGKLDTGANGTSAGAGGAYSRLNAFVFAGGTPYSVVVGTGGASVAGGAAHNGNAGNDSSFSSSAVLLAKGGSGGLSGGTTVSGVSGGQASSGVGDVKFNGGDSASSVGTTGSSGGSSAGTAANGNIGTFNSSSQTTAPTGGGNGGAGNTTGGVGGNGVAPGGGSGTALSNFASGTGADGQVIITALLGVITSATGGVHTSDGTNDYWTFTASGTWTPNPAAPSTSNYGTMRMLIGVGY